MKSGGAGSGRRFRVDPGVAGHSGPSGPTQDLYLEEAAKRRVADHDYFRPRLSELTIRCRGGVLEVEGLLPTFYLKQVLQTCLRELPGVGRIENRVVVSTSGLCGPPRTRGTEGEG